MTRCIKPGELGPRVEEIQRGAEIVRICLAKSNRLSILGN